MEFESQVGDLTSILKVDERRRNAAKEIFEDRQALLLIDRYKFMNLAPCTQDQLKFMGYSVRFYKLKIIFFNNFLETISSYGC